MSSRVAKRPLESHSRGNSPPDKRHRPPDSPSTLQERHANSALPKIPSPPPSRKCSLTESSRVSARHKPASDHRRPEIPRHQIRQHVRVRSPNSVASGESTPTCHAFPAPSMLPVAEVSTSRQPHISSSLTDRAPITMHALRKLRDRKRDIAHHMTPTRSTTADTKLVAQGMDIAHLRKELDRINKEREEERHHLNVELDKIHKEREEERHHLNDQLDQLKKARDERRHLNDELDHLKKARDERRHLKKELDTMGELLGKVAEYSEKIKDMEKNLAKLHKDMSDLQDDMQKCIGPITDDYNKTKVPLSQRVANLQTTVSQSELGRLSIRVDELEKAARDLHKLSTRVDQLEQGPKAPISQTPATPVLSSHASTAATTSTTDELFNLEASASASPLDKHIDDIKTDINSLFDAVSNHDDSIAVLQDSVPILFNQHFDPFKLKVEEQLRTTSDMLHTQDRHLSNLAQQVSNLPFNPSGVGQQQQAQLDAIVADTATLKTDVATLKSSLLTKANSEKTSRQLEGFGLALRVLETRWENISTDEIYQRMVHWFAQTYPGLAQVAKDIGQLKAFQSWMEPHLNTLNGLSRDAHHLHSLISMASQLQDLVKVTGQVLGLANSSPQLQSLAMSAPALDQLLSNASQLQSLVTSAPALDQLLSNASQLQSLVTSAPALDQLLSNASQLQNLVTSAPALDQLLSNASQLQSLTAFRDEVLQTLTKVEQAYSSAQTAITNTEQTEQRLSEQVTALERISSSVSCLERSVEMNNSVDDLKRTDDSDKVVLAEVKSGYETNLPKIWERFSEVQGATAKLRGDLDTIINTYIEPNRDFFGLLGTALVVIAQLQQVVESLNENSPVAPLKLEWKYYLPTLGQPEHNGESSNSKGEDKSTS